MPMLLFTLEHEPGPAWQHERPWQEQDFSAHFAFQQYLAERGLLVGAGPRPDRPGHGMTLVRAADETEARRLATEVDGSVAGGLLKVTVRPWLVVDGPGLDGSGLDGPGPGTGEA